MSRRTPADEPLTAEEQARRRAAVPDLFPTTPFMSLLGIVFDHYEPDDVVVRLPFDERWTNDGIAFHGGVTATLLDTAGAAAAWSNHDFGRGLRASTVSISVQFLAAARTSDLMAHARTVRRGRELIFTEITARDDEGTAVAQALQTYRIV